MTAPIHVLYVGDSLEQVAALRDSPAAITVSLAVSPEDALARLGETTFDCLVYAGGAANDERFLSAVGDHSSSVPVVVDAGSSAGVPVDLYERVVDDRGNLAAVVREVVHASDDGVGDAAAPAPPNAESAPSGAREGGPDDVAPALDGPERGRHHELVRENPAFVETVLDSLLDVFFVFTVERELVEWNTPLEEMTGRDADDLAGADPLSILAPEDRDRAFESLADVLTTGRATAEFDIVSADGERIPCEFTASLITEDGAPRYVCGIGRDVTDLREKQAELERKQAELDRAVEELERSNADLEQFAYVASHDMKEPLRMVTSYLDLLERRYADRLDEDAREFIEFAVDGAERMRLMIDQLLAYSRIDRKGGEFRPVDCVVVLETVQRNLQVAIEESGAEIEVGSLPTVAGDRDQLIQLFQNLVSNAIKYSEGSPHVEVGATRRDDGWELTVADDGVGIPADRVDRVFEPFYSDDTGVADVDSTGIGLAICQRIVDRHGGDIWVESTAGEGSTFHVILPDEDADAERTDDRESVSDVAGADDPESARDVEGADDGGSGDALPVSSAESEPEPGEPPGT